MQRHTHQATVRPTSKTQKPGACCASVYTISQSFLNSEVHASGAPAAPRPSAGGDLRAPHRFTLPSNPSAGFSNNDVSLCAYATGLAITQKESRRVYRKVLLWYNTGTV